MFGRIVVVELDNVKMPQNNLILIKYVMAISPIVELMVMVVSLPLMLVTNIS